MKLRTLDISRLPGIRPGFSLEGLDDGVNIVVGPNASGKSSLMRALRAVLYKGELKNVPMAVEAVFVDGKGELTATRTGGQLIWQRAGERIEPPLLPEHRFLSCYTLQVEDLLAVEGNTDKEIASRLASELAGGYDLPAVRVLFSLKSTHGKKEAQSLKESEHELNRLRSERQKLRRDEERLKQLKSEMDEAWHAQSDARDHAKALELLEIQRERQELERRLTQFPEGMEKLRGDELERLNQLRHNLQEERASLETALRDRQTAEHKLRETNLEDADLDEATLADYRGPVRKLRQLEGDIKQHVETLTNADTELDEKARQLGAPPDTVPSLDPETIHHVEEQLKHKRELDADICCIDKQLEELPDPDTSATDPEPLRTARSELLHWLTTPEGPTHGRAWAWGVAAVLFAAVVGIAAATVLHWALLGLLLPLGIGVWLAWPRADSRADKRRTAERRFREAGVEDPSQWERAAIQTRLQALDRELLEAERQQTAHQRAVMLTGQRATCEEKRQKTRDVLAEIARNVGFDPEKLDAALDRWIHLLADYDRAYSAAQTTRQRLQTAKDEAADKRAQIVTFLQTYGAAPETDEPDADALEARLEHLGGRIRKRVEARNEIATADERERQSRERIEGLEGNIRDLYTQAGVPDGNEATLRDRVEQLGEWKTLREQHSDKHSVERDRRQALTERDDLIQRVEADDEIALQQERDTLEKQAKRYEEIVAEIKEIEAAIKTAQQERALEATRAKMQQARDTLTDCLDEALFAEAGSFLLETVSSEHQRTSQPEALRRARDWFRQFTHHQFELDFDTDGGSWFAAIETTSGERRRLSELSSGTRMQLLLAVRTAFALEAEKGCEPLPLILDEALTTADPERFHAAAESLHTLAQNDDRQIFYLTAQPADVGYWREFDDHVNCVDLAQVRGTGLAITDPNQIEMPARRDIPAPDGQTPEEYAVALDVPAIDAWNASGAVHLFYLLRDRLDLLHRLVRARIEHIGELRSVLDSKTADTLLSADEKNLLRCRIAGAETWFKAWRWGRGQPLDRTVLEETPVVTETYFDRVAEQADEVSGDAKRLLERLANKAVSGFGPQKVDRLRDWLMDHGYLDEREPLSEAAIEHEMLSVMATYLDDSDKSVEEARLLCDSLVSGINQPL